jgi:hypothetical protein
MDKKDICSRCKGKGILTAFMHVNMGICFRCGGSGISPIKSKVYMFKIWINDGHAREARANHKFYIERSVNSCTPADVAEYLSKQGWKPATYEGSSGVLTVTSIEFEVMREKLTLRNKV